MVQLKNSRAVIKINYYNNGKVISSSRYTQDLQKVTQQAVNVAMQLILQIHAQQPTNCYVTVTQGKTELLKVPYTG